MTPPIVVAPPAPPPEPAPSWFLTLTNAQRKLLLGWLRVRKVDTTAWPK